MLAAELALADVDVAIVERRVTRDLAGSRAGGLSSRTLEVLDQRGVAERFLSQGKAVQVAAFAMIPLSIGDFHGEGCPTPSRTLGRRRAGRWGPGPRATAWARAATTHLHSVKVRHPGPEAGRLG
jgi:2-polyprenyl-6-methoxyphenol hydroxylase-like FAD-dependent oxidoreductase